MSTSIINPLIALQISATAAELILHQVGTKRGYSKIVSLATPLGVFCFRRGLQHV